LGKLGKVAGSQADLGLSNRLIKRAGLAVLGHAADGGDAARLWAIERQEIEDLGLKLGGLPIKNTTRARRNPITPAIARYGDLPRRACAILTRKRRCIVASGSRSIPDTSSPTKPGSSTL
jgi:hypothetical protein